MLGNWESHPIPPGMVSDLHPRHAPEIRFRPHTVSIRRDEEGRPVVVKISGNRLCGGGGLPQPGTLDSWEWDRDRDPGIEWLSELLAEVAGQ